jgi:hypothetical protein
MSFEPPCQHEVFISYSSKDKKWADAACAVLERHRIRCWIAPRDIIPGSEWGASIISAIDACKIMVLIFSGHANASGQVRREVERAISKGLSVLPCRVENIAPSGAMEYALSNTHWLDAFTPPVERQMEVLARSVKALLTNSTAAPTPIEVEEAPTPPGGIHFSPKGLAVAAAAAVFLMAGIAVGFMLTRSKPADPEPPPVTSPVEEAAKRREVLAARNRGGAVATSPPGTPTRARPEPEAIAAVTRPEPKVVAVVRWVRDDIPGQEDFDHTYFENGRLDWPYGDATWSLKQGVLRQKIPDAAPGGGPPMVLFWFGVDGKTLRAVNNAGATFSGRVTRGSFGYSSGPSIAAVIHLRDDRNPREQWAHIMYHNGHYDELDGEFLWSLRGDVLQFSHPMPGGQWVYTGSVAADGLSARITNQNGGPLTIRVLSGSLRGVAN